MRQIALIGAGGHARVVWDTVRLLGEREGIETSAVLDDNPKLWGAGFLGLPIRGPLSQIRGLGVDAAIIAVGDNRARREIYTQLRDWGIPLANAIHPAAVIAKGVQLGSGIVAFAGVVVNIGASIGDNVILNTACSVDHDCVIGAHAHIAPGVHLAGTVFVGEGSLVGIGSAALPNVKIGNWTTIGAGAIITQDIPDGVTAVGTPARILKR